MRILLVEDEPQIADFIRRGLSENGYSVDVAPDGEEALQWPSVADFDIIIECTGVGQVIADSLHAVAPGGVVCLTGVGSGGRTTGFATADLAATMVLQNNVIVGSVNANKRHWYKAAQLLARADRAWLSRLITRREPPDAFMRALQRQPDDIKVVLQFSEA